MEPMRLSSQCLNTIHHHKSATKGFFSFKTPHLERDYEFVVIIIYSIYIPVFYPEGNQSLL